MLLLTIDHQRRRRIRKNYCTHKVVECKKGKNANKLNAIVLHTTHVLYDNSDLIIMNYTLRFGLVKFITVTDNILSGFIIDD